MASYKAWAKRYKVPTWAEEDESQDIANNTELPSDDLDEDGVYLVRYLETRTGTLEALELYNDSDEGFDIHRAETQEAPEPNKWARNEFQNKSQHWKPREVPIGPRTKNPMGKQTKHTNSQRLAEEDAKGKPELSFEEIVPKEYWDYKEVFTG